MLSIIAVNKTYQKFYAPKYLGILLLCIIFSNTNAQDTTNKLLILPEFSIAEKLDKMYSKINTHQLDSAVLANSASSSLATLLAKNSAVTIRSYGATGLSSVSMRGGNSNHTAVLWNGFNIQDPLNGGYNFSSSNVSFIDKVSIQHGGSSSAFGSGAIGGTVHLTNSPVFNKKLYGSGSYSYGNYGLSSTNLKIGSGSKKFATSIRVFRKAVKNNFEFKNLAKIDSPTEKYDNAAMEQYGALFDFYYKIKSNQLLSSQFWYQHNFREIPPNITSSTIENEQYQKEDWFRWALNWKKTGKKIEYNARTGVFYTTSNYFNEVIDVNSTHNSLKNITETSATITFLKNQRITLGLFNDFATGLSENFIDDPSLNTSALYISPGFTILKKIKLNLSFRAENYAEKFTPPTHSANLKYNFFKRYFLTASFSKNYRSPTFNDLYWNSGSALGNRDLQAEYGYSKDIGLEVNKTKNKVNIKSNISFYNNIINNQIQWQPEGQIWTPRNVKLVETNGVELMFNSDYKLSNSVDLFINLSYAYTDAQTKERSATESDDILNKQLIYIPFYQTNAVLGARIKNISANVNTQYVGYQFTKVDNSDWIDAYFLTDFSIQYKVKVKKTVFILSTQANNIFNTIYEQRQWYPMPQVNYEIGIKAIIN